MRFSLRQVSESFLEDAPWIFRSELELDISMEECWKILLNDEAFKDWHPEVQNIVWASDTRDVGTSRSVKFSGKYSIVWYRPRGNCTPLLSQPSY